MAVVTQRFVSKALQTETVIHIVIPFDRYDYGKKPLTDSAYDKTVILLHGLRQSGEMWLRQTNLERYAAEHGFCAVLPDTQRSFCTNMAYGLPYYDYISEEVPAMIRTLYNIPADPDHLYIGGLSAGGYGALKCALHHPERYAGVLCYSSGFYMLDDPPLLNAYEENELIGLMGPELKRAPEDDLDAAAQKASGCARLPFVYLSCGIQEARRPENLRMRETLLRNHFDVLYEEWPALHNWENWDTALQKSFAYTDRKIKEKQNP